MWQAFGPMTVVRWTAISALVFASGCFSEPPPGTSGTDASSSGTTPSGGIPTDAMSSTGRGSSGAGEGEGSSGVVGDSTGSGGEPCECQAAPAGWAGPFVVMSGAEPPPPCPGGASAIWQARADLDTGMCECDCAPPQGDCEVEAFIAGSGCKATATPLSGMECDPYENVAADNLWVQAGVPQLTNVACTNPDPPVPTFEAFAQACPAEVCTGGACAPPMGSAANLCISMEGVDDVPDCPAPFSQRRVVAEAAELGSLSCDACGCQPEKVTCEGEITFYVDEDCDDPAGSFVPVNTTCEETDVAGSEVGGLRYDVALGGACVGGSEVAPVVGEPDWIGPRTLCCI